MSGGKRKKSNRTMSTKYVYTFGDGKAEGKAEEQRQIAANFKKQGIGIETIALCTGLPIEEIERL